MTEQLPQNIGHAKTNFRLDEVDRKILSLQQEDASLSLDQIADRVGASKTPVWTGRPDRAAQVVSPTNCSAFGVGTTVTSWPDSRRRRRTSHAL